MNLLTPHFKSHMSERIFFSQINIARSLFAFFLFHFNVFLEFILIFFCERTNLKFLWQSVRSTAETFYRTNIYICKKRKNKKKLKSWRNKKSRCCRRRRVTCCKTFYFIILVMWNQVFAVMSWLLLASICFFIAFNSFEKAWF